MGNLGVGFGIVAQGSKLIEARLNYDGALLVNLAVIICRDVIVSIWANIAIESEDWGASRISALEDVRILHSQPSREHATVGASTDNDSPVLETLGLFKVENELNVVHHGLLDSQILEIVKIEAGVTERHRSSEVTMLTEDNEGTEFFRKCSRHEARIVEESPDITFVTSVEKNRPIFFVKVGIIDEVAHLVGVRSCTVVGEMINIGVIIVLLRVEVSLTTDPVLNGFEPLRFSPRHTTHEHRGGDFLRINARRDSGDRNQ